MKRSLLVIFCGGLFFGCGHDLDQSPVELNQQEEQIVLQKKESIERVFQGDEKPEQVLGASDQVVEPSVFSEKYMDYSLNSEEVLREQVAYGLLFTSKNCTDCQELEKGIVTHMRELPAGTKMLKVNFDKETKLRQKYEVTMPHTLVYIDSAGEYRDKIEWVDLEMIKRLFTK